MRLRLAVFLTLSILLSRLAAAEVFDFRDVSLEFPGSWSIEPTKDGYMATAALDGQKVFLRVIGIPGPSQGAADDERRWLEAESGMDWFFAVLLGEKRDAVGFDVPDSSRRLPNRATFREIVWHLKSDPANKSKFAAFAIKRGYAAVIAMPGHHEHGTLSQLNRIRSILMQAKWN